MVDTLPANKQVHDSPASNILLQPSVGTVDGSVYVHKDYVRIVEPWAVEQHIGPIKANESFGDVKSWAAYVANFTRDSNVLLKWNVKGLHAVLDYHDFDGTPNRCQWTAEHPFIVSPEWAAWVGVANGQAIPHKRAVEFLEDRGEDIVDPAPADLMGLLRSLRANVSAQASTELRPDGTTAIAFAQDKTVRSGNRDVEIPPEIVIAIPVLKGHTDEQGNPVKYRMRVRLRASVDDGAHLSLRFSLQNAERTLETVVTERVNEAKTLLGDSYSILRAA